MDNTFSEQTDQPVALVTFTGEIIQPVRLHYEILNLTAVLKVFDRLKCVKTVELDRCVQWYYMVESKNGAFKITKNNDPKTPIVLATIFLDVKEKHLTIRTLCKERALYALTFFDKYIRRRDLKVVEMDTYNFILTNTPENMQAMENLNLLFPEKDIQVKDSSTFDHFAASVKARGITGVDALRALYIFLEAESLKPISPIERIPVYFYEDGLQSVRINLVLRYIVAMEHFKGNTAYTMKNAIDRIHGLEG